ncbi:MAG: DUF92 domain-containing protein [Chlorobiales bacterium]|nr:DUF92 domain-containing protein [Chlorobiales bacterium]
MLKLQAPSPHDLPVFFLLLGIMMLSLLLFEVLARKFSVSRFVLRKVLHFSLGLLLFFFPVLFKANFYPVLLALLFTVFNTVCVRVGLLQVLHGKDESNIRGEKVQRSYGPIVLPVAFVILALFLWENHAWILRTSVLVAGIADSLAAFAGGALGKVHIENLTKSRKTVEGSLTMFAVSFFLLLACFFTFRDSFGTGLADASLLELVAFALLLSLIATAVEALLSHGFDNLMIPLAVCYVLYIIDTDSAGLLYRFLSGGMFALLLAVFSIKVKFLNNSGATATFLLGTTIFGIGGLVWTVPLLTFYLLSSILSKLGKKRKAQFDLVFEKGSQRDAGQVCANGGIAWIIMIVYSLTGEPAYFFAYLGTLAAVQSDTWATEIGTMWPNPKARLITTMKPVPVGTSGGVSFPGTLGAFIGALLICASAILMQVGWLIDFGVVQSFMLIGLSGLVASLVDSFFGATIQAQYYDPVREKVTERTSSFRSDGTVVENKLIKGYRYVNNDVVNTLCALSGCALAFFFSQSI